MLAFMIVLGRDTWLLWTSIRSFMVLLAPLLLRFLLVILSFLPLPTIQLPFVYTFWLYCLTHPFVMLSQFQLARPERTRVLKNITVLHCVIRIRGSPLRTMICSQRFWVCEWSLMDLKHTRYNIILSGYFSIGAQRHPKDVFGQRSVSLVLLVPVVKAMPGRQGQMKRWGWGLGG